MLHVTHIWNIAKAVRGIFTTLNIYLRKEERLKKAKVNESENNEIINKFHKT